MSPKKTSKKTGSPKKSRGRPPKDPDKLWQRAKEMSSTVNDRYSMKVREQELAFKQALTLKKGSLMVEIGVTHGRTAAVLCYAAKARGLSYVGIDSFTLEGSVKEVQATFKSLGVDGKLIEGNSNTIPWDKPIDYLLIDGGHDAITFSHDCAKWIPLVKKGGLVLFHDYSPGVLRSDAHWAIAHYADAFTNDWIKIDFIPSLMIRKRP